MTEKINFPSNVEPENGMGVTASVYTDCWAGTIVKMSGSKKRIYVQKDDAVLDPNWKPEIIPGGFLGHCTNQREQTYTYSQNTENPIRVFTLRKMKSGETCWKQVGANTNSRGSEAYLGYRRKFHDYNF